MTGAFSGAALLFTAHGDAREFARDIDEFLNSAGDLLQIALDAGAAVP
jgi:hypothetical protein